MIKLVAILFVISFALTGCVYKQSAPSPAPVTITEQNTQTSMIVHEVRSRNESLAEISYWYTGKRQNTAKLKSITPGLKNKLSEGTLVFIPKELLIRSTPMPLTAKKNSPKTSSKTNQTTQKTDQQPAKNSEWKITLAKAPPQQAPAANHSLHELPAPPGIDTQALFEREKLWQELIDSVE